MRIYTVSKLGELAEECNGDKKFMESEWVAVDDLKEFIKKQFEDSALRDYKTMDNISWGEIETILFHNLKIKRGKE